MSVGVTLWMSGICEELKPYFFSHVTYFVPKNCLLCDVSIMFWESLLTATLYTHAIEYTDD